MKLTGLSPALTYTPLFSPSQTHSARAYTSWHARAHAQHAGIHGPRFRYTCTHHTSTSPTTTTATHLHHPLHPHISREHHTSCRRSLSCQLQTRCESRMLTERRYVEVTHEPRHIWRILEETSRNASVVGRALCRTQADFIRLRERRYSNVCQTRV